MIKPINLAEVRDGLTRLPPTPAWENRELVLTVLKVEDDDKRQSLLEALKILKAEWWQLGHSAEFTAAARLITEFASSHCLG